MKRIASLILLLCASATLLRGESADTPKEISGHLTVLGAKASARPDPIRPRYVYGADRDWNKQPYRLAVVLVDFSDKKHGETHTAALYDDMLFSRDHYHKTPAGKLSYGSLADWYRTQSQGRFVLTGKVFDWLTMDQTFEEVHTMKFKDAQNQYLKASLAKIRERDGAQALDGFDGYLFLHSGPITGPPGNIFWSHRADVAGKRYVTSGEIEEMNVLCHEFGHVLGLPDLYGKKGVRESFGPWCTMSSGYRGLYPKSFCVWSKVHLGWCRPKVIDADTRQKLALRPIQSHPDDAFLIPLNKTDGPGEEFLLLENRAATGNDTEGQAGLFIWRITCKAGSDGEPGFELALPGPADTGKDNLQTRRVAWPAGDKHDFLAPAQDGSLPAAIRNIHLEGDAVLFDIGPE